MPTREIGDPIIGGNEKKDAEKALEMIIDQAFPLIN